MKQIKNIICLCTAFLMISTLASCSSSNSSTVLPFTSKSASSLSDNSDKNKTASQITQYYDELPVEGTEDFSKIFKMKYSGDKLYVLGQKRSVKNRSVFSTDLTTLETSQTQNNDSIPDGSEEMNIYRDIKGNIYDCSMGSVKVYDKNLNPIKTIDNKFFEEYDVSNLFIYSSVISENGDIYIAASLKSSESIRIIKLNSSFEIQYITEKGAFSDCGDHIDNIFIGKNGNLVLCTSNDSVYINEISSDTGTTLLRYERPITDRVIGVWGDYNVICQKDNVIYGYDYLSDNTTELCSIDESVTEITQAYIRDNSLITEQIEKGNAEIILSIYDKDGKAVKDISISGTDHPKDISITKDGTVLLLDEHRDWEYNDEETFETTQPEIISISEDGTLKTIYRSEKQSDPVHLGPSYIFASDSKGNICICPQYRHNDIDIIHATFISSSGEQTDMEYEENGSVSNIFCINDELKIAFFSDQSDPPDLLTVNKETLTIDKLSSDTVPRGFELAQGNNGYDYYYIQGNTINGYNIADNSSAKIFSWFDTDVETVPRNNIDDIAIEDPDNIFYIKNAEYNDVNNYDSDTSDEFPISVIHLKKADEERLRELNSRNIITLAGMNIDDSGFAKIKMFNRINNEYMIMVTDYAQYDSYIDAGDSEGMVKDLKGLGKFEADIARGIIPDVIFGDWSLDIQKLLSKDALADLNDFIRTDTEIDKNDLVQNILDACTYNDKLYCIPLNFYLTTLTVPDENTENNDVLSFDEFFSLYDKFTDKTIVNSSREDILKLLVSSYVSDNVDFGKAECNFKTDTFKKILEKSKSCISDHSVDYSEEYYMDTTASEFLFRQTDICSFSGLFFDLSYHSSNEYQPVSYCLKGIPSSSGITSLMNLSSYICITNASENKEGAWKLLKYISGINNDSDPDTSSFCVGEGPVSVLRSANKKNIDDFTSENLNTAFFDYTQSDIDKVADIYNTVCNSKVLMNIDDSKIFQIISEQAELFFNDTQSLEETVCAVQSKVTLYLSEIK